MKSAPEEDDVSSIGDFTVIGRVAGTAATTVLKAHDAKLGRDVALRQLPSSTPEEREQWEADARRLASLSDEHVVTVYGIAAAEDTVWRVEEWVEGATLAATLAAIGRLSTSQSLGVIRGALIGLSDAHARGIVHGDVSASTILIDADGTSRLTGFGSSSRSGSSPATDVYGAATVLAQLLTGVPGDVRGVDTQLKPVLDRALAPDPDLRYPDAGAFLAALEEASSQAYGSAWWTLTGLGGAAPPATEMLVPITEGLGGASALGAGPGIGSAAPLGAGPGVGSAAPLGAGPGIGSAAPLGAGPGVGSAAAIGAGPGVGAAVPTGAGLSGVGAAAVTAGRGGRPLGKSALLVGSVVAAVIVVVAGGVTLAVTGSKDDESSSSSQDPSTEEDDAPAAPTPSTPAAAETVPDGVWSTAIIATRTNNEWFYSSAKPQRSTTRFRSSCAGSSCSGTVGTRKWDFTWNGTQLTITPAPDIFEGPCQDPDGKSISGSHGRHVIRWTPLTLRATRFDAQGSPTRFEGTNHASARVTELRGGCVNGYAPHGSPRPEADLAWTVTRKSS